MGRKKETRKRRVIVKVCHEGKVKEFTCVAVLESKSNVLAQVKDQVFMIPELSYYPPEDVLSADLADNEGSSSSDSSSSSNSSSSSSISSDERHKKKKKEKKKGSRKRTGSEQAKIDASNMQNNWNDGGYRGYNSLPRPKSRSSTMERPKFHFLRDEPKKKELKRSESERGERKRSRSKSSDKEPLKERPKSRQERRKDRLTEITEMDNKLTESSQSSEIPTSDSSLKEEMESLATIVSRALTIETEDISAVELMLEEAAKDKSPSVDTSPVPVEDAPKERGPSIKSNKSNKSNRSEKSTSEITREERKSQKEEKRDKKKELKREREERKSQERKAKKDPKIPERVIKDYDPGLEQKKSQSSLERFPYESVEHRRPPPPPPPGPEMQDHLYQNYPLYINGKDAPAKMSAEIIKHPLTQPNPLRRNSSILKIPPSPSSQRKVVAEPAKGFVMKKMPDDNQSEGSPALSRRASIFGDIVVRKTPSPRFSAPKKTVSPLDEIVSGNVTLRKTVDGGAVDLERPSPGLGRVIDPTSPNQLPSQQPKRQHIARSNPRSFKPDPPNILEQIKSPSFRLRKVVPPEEKKFGVGKVVGEPDPLLQIPKGDTDPKTSGYLRLLSDIQEIGQSIETAYDDVFSGDEEEKNKSGPPKAPKAPNMAPKAPFFAPPPPKFKQRPLEPQGPTILDQIKNPTIKLRKVERPVEKKWLQAYEEVNRIDKINEAVSELSDEVISEVVVEEDTDGYGIISNVREGMAKVELSVSKGVDAFDNVFHGEEKKEKPNEPVYATVNKTFKRSTSTSDDSFIKITPDSTPSPTSDLLHLPSSPTSVFTIPTASPPNLANSTNSDTSFHSTDEETTRKFGYALTKRPEKHSFAMKAQLLMADEEFDIQEFYQSLPGVMKEKVKLPPTFSIFTSCFDYISLPF